MYKSSKRSMFFAIICAVFFASIAQAQTPTAAGPADLIVKVSTGAGTYTKLFQQIANVCPQPSMEPSESAGTLEALDDMLNNRANVAFIPTDVLFGRKMIENDSAVDNLRVLMPLYTAELHLVASRQNGEINKFSDLGNKKIGAYGSGYITSRILMGNANLRPISLTNFNTEAELLAAIQKNIVDVGFIVVGQPATWATKLDGKAFKLIDFDRLDLLSKIGGYVNANLRYPNLSTSVVKTLGVKVNLVTYNYDSSKKVKDLSALKRCITEHIADLRETTGNHPKWRDVQPNATSDWPMFGTQTVVEKSKKKK